MSTDDARDFLESIAGYTDEPQGEIPSQDKPVKLGTVDALYTTGNPKVLFDGETLMGVRTYPTLAPVRPGDRVVMLPQGHTYVVLGTVGSVAGSNWPVGTLIEGLWTSAPTGFLMLIGTVVLRADYPALYAVLGTTYNTGGETSLQFRLPDTRGAGTMHKSASGTLATLGAKGGEEKHTQTLAELAAHTHGMGYEFGVAGGDSPRIVSNPSSFAVSSWSAGSSTPFNVLDPFIVVNRAVKY